VAKAIISNRILLDVTPEQDKAITSELTYRIETRSGPRGELQTETIRTYKRIKPGILSLPQGRIDLIPKENEIIDKRVLVPETLPAPKFNLFPEQQIIYDQVDDTCFINALVGWGKTFTALWIAYKLGQKTLVVVHTAALRDQWVKEVEKLFDFTPAIYGGGIRKLNSPIVIGNIQTLNKDGLELSDKFGTIIMDEAHHVPATTFTEFMDKMKARYRISLSGTMLRKDGKHVLFKDYFGPKVFKPPQNNTLNPKVYIIKSGIRLRGTSWAVKVNNLLYDEEYQVFISALAKKYINMGHKVLVVADRTEFLERCHHYTRDDTVLIVGETKNRRELLDMVSDGRKHGVWGSRHIFAEGISENILSCLILAGPINNNVLLEQLIGRIMRLHDEKLNPIVLDINFSGPSEKKQNANRLAFYIEKGWDIAELA
jgi:superfamily II DNA or RNA helicase